MPTEWEEKLVNNTSDKGLLSNIYEEFIQLKGKKQRT